MGMVRCGLHLAGDRNDRRQAEVGEDDAAGGNGGLNPSGTEGSKALAVQVFRFEKAEQHHDHQQRHQKFQHADQVIGFGEGFDAVVVEREEKAQQRQLHQPADRRRVAGTRQAEEWEPGGGVLPGGDDFDGDQA